MKDADNMSDFKALCREIIAIMDDFDYGHYLGKNTILNEHLNKIYNLVDEISIKCEEVENN